MVCGERVCASVWNVAGMRIGIIAAVPLELKHIARGWEVVPCAARYAKAWRTVDAAGDIRIAACAGMGADAARRAFAAAEADGLLDGVLSVGLAGATLQELRVGECLVLSEVIDASTGERFTLTDGKRRLRIASLSQVADAREKNRVRETYGAVMVDMESATVARMAQQRGIPMCCIKAVSDEVDAVLPDVGPFLREGQLRLAPFLASVAMRPSMWGPLLRLGGNSSTAAKRLAVTVNEFLRDKDWAGANRTGGIGEQG